MSYPHIVVAVVCVEDDKVLMVNELDNGINCWNQPAGHVEVNETLQDAAIRETLEESGYKVSLTGIQGIYQGLHKETLTHYVRVVFTAKVTLKTDLKLDPDIIKAEWIPLLDLLGNKYSLRSPLTLQTLEDIGNAPIVPLSLIHQSSMEIPNEQ
jgi:ADP-ribose pyrophosphatase YjhB (NUDIX family)